MIVRKKRKKKKENEQRKVFERAKKREERGGEGEGDREDNGNIEILDHRYDDVVRNFGKEPIFELRKMSQTSRLRSLVVLLRSVDVGPVYLWPIPK